MRTDPALNSALAGAAALCAVIGLARFGYVPLFPALVAAGWVGGGEAGALGAINFTGYLAGALLGPLVGARLGTRRALDAGMGLAGISFLACALHLGFPWLATWRAAAGLAGGVTMALIGPAVQAVTEPSRRGRAGGLVLAGVGAGVMTASLLVPALVAAGGVSAAWAGLGLAVGALWAFAHPYWPDAPVNLAPVNLAPVNTASSNPHAAAQASITPPRGVALLILAYTLSAAGMVAPMVYLGDLAGRGHGLGVAAAGLVWALFGLGGLGGTLAAGLAADRLGRRAMPIWLGVQVAALAAALLPHPAAVPLASLLSGFSGVGISAVALARLRAMTGAATPRHWSRATALYAAAQAVTGYALAWLFALAGDAHAPVFLAGLVLSLAGLLVALGRG